MYVCVNHRCKNAYEAAVLARSLFNGHAPLADVMRIVTGIRPVTLQVAETLTVRLGFLFAEVEVVSDLNSNN